MPTTLILNTHEDVVPVFAYWSTKCCRLAKDAEVDRLLNAETQLREELEQQLTVEQQHWCLEKDALQKVLQEQQGTAHALEQHLTNQITALQHQLAKQHTGQETAARSHQDTVAALQTANQQLQQQCGRLEQDLHAALAYRHKCIQQKEELQQLRKHTCEARVRPEHDQGFAGDNADAPAEALQHGAGATHAHAGKLKELAALVRSPAALDQLHLRPIRCTRLHQQIS